jgi:hypothetical protein
LAAFATMSASSSATAWSSVLQVSMIKTGMFEQIIGR